MTELLLGVDVGTASTKGVLVDLDGTILARADRKHEVSLPRPGWAEMDAEAVWWDDVVAIARQLTSATEQPIAGVCVSGIGPCLLLCDSRLRPVRPAILYGIDTRATTQIDRLNDALGPARMLERCGSALSSQAIGPKLMWVQENEADVFAQARRWYNSNSFLVAKLTGEYIIDHHTASQCDPMYDVHTREWIVDWAESLSAGLELPRLIWPTEVAGHVNAAAAAETGLAQGTPVCAGTVDAWAEAFSVGVRHPGDTMLMYGSTMFMINITRDAQVVPGLWSTCGVERASHSLAAGTATGGSLTSWIADLCDTGDVERLDAEAGQAEPGCDGLLMLPYFAGERTPIYDPDARGVLAGLTLRHQRGHLFRAAYEGIAFGLRSALDLFDGDGRLVAVGGGTNSDVWLQIVSDVTQRCQDIPEVTVGASYGDALMAGIGTGTLAPDTDWTRVARTVEPNASNAEMYRELAEEHARLYRSTVELVHRLGQSGGDLTEANHRSD